MQSSHSDEKNLLNEIFRFVRTDPGEQDRMRHRGELAIQIADGVAVAVPRGAHKLSRGSLGCAIAG